MKQLTHFFTRTSIYFKGIIVGIKKGHETKNRWMSHVKNLLEERRAKAEQAVKEVMLDDFEIAAFHQN